MGKNIEGLVAYLQQLAPDFFKERMVGASTEEIAGLEKAARTQLTESHREFLTVFGGTPAQALNPFLNDRDYCVECLLEAYAILDEAEERLPPGIVYFSASDILGETIFLRQAEKLDMEPEIGDINFETGAFGAKDKRFVSWLQWSAFGFRISQPEYQIGIEAPWDNTAKRWLGEPEKCWELLKGMGFSLIFNFENGNRCSDRGDIAATIHLDGSGTLAGDDLEELQGIVRVFNKNFRIKANLKHESDRMRAPIS